MNIFIILKEKPQKTDAMLKKIIFTVTALLIGMNLLAQKTDLVKLKNGSVIRGNIVSIVPDGNVTINDNAGNTWVFRMTEISSIEETEDANPNSLSAFSPGWVSLTSIGFLAGSQSSSYIAPFSIQTSAGYRNSAGIYTGLLTGLEFINVTYIPIMVDLQYSLRQGRVMPVVIARGGYVVPSDTEDQIYGTTYNYSGGITGAVGIGLKVRSEDIFAWEISALYRYMQINYTEEYEWQTYNNTYKDIYNRMELRLGIYLGR